MLTSIIIIIIICNDS